MSIAPAVREGDGHLRVLFVAHDSGLSGAQRALLTLLGGLDRARFECHVVAPYEGPLVTEARSLGHQVHIRALVRWVPSRRRVAKAGFVGYAGTFVRGLRARAQSVAALVERLGVGVVVTNSVACVEGAWAARMARVPHVWHIHESISGNRDLHGMLPAAVYRAVIGALSAEIVFVSRSVAANYGGLQRRSRVVYPGLPLPPLPDRPSARAGLLQRTGLPAGARLVGVVGALQPGKDHPTFLAAAARVRERVPEACFVIVGGGAADYAGELVQTARALGLEPCTRFLGAVPSGEIHELMAGLDVLVISSVQESFGLTAIESLAVETPVVATRCGGPSEILRDGIDGLLVPVGDATALANAIATTLSDAGEARGRSRAGRVHVEQCFSARTYVDAMASVLEAAASRPQSHGQPARSGMTQP